MSRIGLKPVEIPSGVDVQVAGSEVTAKGKLGQLSLSFLDEVSVAVDDGKITVTPANDSKFARSLWGTMRSRLVALVTGVSEGFTRNLEINGVGYRAAVQGNNLVLQLGYSHEVAYPIPEGIKIACERPTAISITGADKQRVGQVAAEIRAYRPPEPYKGKGIKYRGEYVFRKEGKKK
jgi:large subunit ribosomal protein L6